MQDDKNYKEGSILNKHGKLLTFNNPEKNGVEFINVVTNSSAMLGRLLAYDHITTINTFLGVAKSIRRFMDFISTPGYPSEFLSKQRLTKEEIKRIPKPQPQLVPNYWALCAYVTTERIKNDNKLIELLKENTLPFTSMGTTKETLFNKVITINRPNNRLTNYIHILTEIQTMIKSNRFTKEDITAFIEACKEQKDLDILTGVNLPENTNIQDVESDS